jgi:serralysin
MGPSEETNATSGNVGAPDTDVRSEARGGNAQATVNENRWCFAWFEEPVSSGETKAALARKAKWAPGSVISISFLNGNPAIQSRVKEAALGWTMPGLANLTLDFRKNTTDTLIRIAFNPGDGSWSAIGTTCRQIPKNRPTMNFGWLTPQSTDEELQRVVLHEFGHALGLIHEHQSPGGEIHWNRDAVIRELSGPPNNWPEDVIEHNIFEPFNKRESNFTKLDPNSIMMYPIPKRWTIDGFSTGLNNQLSDTDKKFIHQTYL